MRSQRPTGFPIAYVLSSICQLLLLAGLATGPLGPETDPFVGQCKLVKLVDQMKVTRVRADTYAFDFGGGAETIVVDGTDQPGYAGTTLSVAADRVKLESHPQEGRSRAPYGNVDAL
jgi:hypothetical protein